MDKNKLKLRIEDLDFAVEKSMRYHQRRRAFHDFFHRLFMFVIVVAGSTAFSTVSLNMGDVSKISAAITVALAAIDLVWGLSHRARDHEILFRRFSDLAIKIRTGELCEDTYKEWLKERITIESDEPPIYWALEADCDNEVRRAWGMNEEIIKIGWWYRRTMNLIRYAEKHFESAAISK